MEVRKTRVDRLRALVNEAGTIASFAKRYNSIDPTYISQLLFSTEAFLDTVVRDENPDNKERLIAALRSELEESGVAGQQFTPKPGSLPNRMKRQVYQTAEGVTITFEGDKETHGLSTETLYDGRERVTIETQKLSQKT